MTPLNSAMLAKLGLCSRCSQYFSGRLFARAHIYSQALACLVFSDVSFCSTLFFLITVSNLGVEAGRYYIFRALRLKAFLRCS